MSTARHRHQYRYAEYLSALEASQIKLEYSEGEIYEMGGGSPLHAKLAGRLARMIGSQLPKGCEVYSSDLKVRVDAVDLTAFPDLTVVCGEEKTAAIDRLAIMNPILLVEIASRSTEAYDRTKKLAAYKRLASLRGVLLVSCHSPLVTVVERRSRSWDQRDVGTGKWVGLAEPEVRIAVDDLYWGLKLER